MLTHRDRNIHVLQLVYTLNFICGGTFCLVPRKPPKDSRHVKFTRYSGKPPKDSRHVKFTRYSGKPPKDSRHVKFTRYSGKPPKDSRHVKFTRYSGKLTVFAILVGKCFHINSFCGSTFF